MQLQKQSIPNHKKEEEEESVSFVGDQMAGKKTNFSLTCNLLSQYIKEKGSFGDVRVGMNYISSPPEPTKVLHRQPSTMSLLPGVDVQSPENKTFGNEISGKCMDLLGPNITADKKESQLTIFYGGKVTVFDNFPAEKLNELMQMVKKGSSKVSTTDTFGTGSLPESKPSQSHTAPDLPMPIARRASLHRFFEKRKDRINSKAPYPVNVFSTTTANTTKSKNTETWLGLGQDFSKV